MIAFASKSDIGKERKMNQDFCIASGKRPQLFILCDGMGGHQSGEVASQTAAESIETYIRLQNVWDLDEIKAEKMLKNAVAYANKIVFNRAMSAERYAGMGTTLDICLLDFDMLYIAHVGDSRVYLLRNNALKCITRDHSYIEEMLQKGIITEEEALNHPRKNVITRAVGTNSEVEPDFTFVQVQKGDIFLMCSDGLSNMLSDEKIKSILFASDTPDKAVDALIHEANQSGGLDNITAIVVKNS